MFINILIIFFTILILYQIIQKVDNFTEGFTTTPPSSSQQQYQSYDTNNPNNALILGQQNAGNIQVLKQQMDSLLGLKKEVEDISGNLISLTEQVTALMQQQQSTAKSVLPSSPPKITGSV
jgi:hypothetical protein